MGTKNIRTIWSKWIVLSALFVSAWSSNPWKVTTACFGSDILCSMYSMECDAGQQIALGQLKYGTKGDLDCVFGISNCNTEAAKKCCSYDPTDTLTDFSASNRSSVVESCEGKQSCSERAPRISSTPSSSYVWMQYACINATNVANMCSESMVVGKELFLQFNILHGFVAPNSPSRNSCSCKITASSCETKLNVTFVDMNLQLPQDDMTTLCSNTTLEAKMLNKTYHCVNSEMDRVKMTSFQVQSPGEIISLRNINTEPSDTRDKVLIYVEAIPESPMAVRCFPPGYEITTNTNCQTTTSQTLLTTVPPEISQKFTQTTSVVTKPPTVSIESSSSEEATEPSSPSSSKTKSSPTLNLITASKHSSMEPSTTKQVKASTKPSTALASSTPTDNTPFVTSTSLLSTTIPSVSTKSSSSLHTRVSSSHVNLSVSTGTASPNQTETLHYSNSSKRDHLSVTKTTMHVSNISLRPTTHFISYNPSPSHISQPAVQSTESTKPNTNKNHSGILSEVPPRPPNGATNLATVTIIDVVETTATVSTGNGDDNDNRGLVIGITVAVVVVMLIIVGVLVTCLWIRIKRKEAVRRNYVRNTNIFYSFPQDYDDIGSMKSDNNSPDVTKRSDSLRNVSEKKSSENGQVLHASPTQAFLNNPVRFENYKIQTDPGQKDGEFHSRMAYDNFAGETTSETIDYFNGVENETSGPATFYDNRLDHGGKSVKFDPSTIYAQVSKEGRTKF